MKLFIDSSDLDEIREALQYGVSGVTTNPTTMAKAEEGLGARVQAICELTRGLMPISVQVTQLDYMYEQGLKLLDLDPACESIVVKVPATVQGFDACRKLSIAAAPLRKPGRVNVTLVFSSIQALIAAQNGAWCVSPFLCRWRDSQPETVQRFLKPREEGRRFLRSIINAVKGTDCQVLAASIRSPEDVEDAIEAGCDIATVSLQVLRQMMRHSKTEEGLAKFMEDWEAVKK